MTVEWFRGRREAFGTQRFERPKCKAVTSGDLEKYRERHAGISKLIAGKPEPFRSIASGDFGRYRVIIISKIVYYYWGHYMKRSMVALAGALALALTGATSPAFATTTSTPAQITTGFSGSAYGSYIFNTDKTLTSGPTASASVACTGATGKTASNNVTGLNVPAVGTVGNATTTVKTLLTTTSKRIEGKSTVAGANLLGGLITAGAITSESTAEKNTAGAFAGTNQTTIADLKVLGIAVNANPAANTVIDLKVPLLGSVGKVTLNGQEKRLVGGTTYTVSTTALRVEILKAGLLGLKVGTDIRLGVSNVKLTPPQTGYLAGTGYGTRATLASGLVGSGPTAVASVKCGGGTSTANVAAVNIPGVALAGASVTTATGVLTPEAKSSVVNTIGGVNVLNGVIQVDAIKAETSASRPPSGGAVKLTDTSTFTNLRIAGLPAINASVAPNTVIQVPGLGQVTLHKVSKSSTTIIVTMIEIVLSQALGTLPTGSKIQIGYSNSSVGA
ncbi:choice-of-anchor P family protein [Arthrobacter sp. 18067]|uniref:choice-of-anchor P family protein n=1 Tax=Arthrobacter sp. 18067 TaxID=2681413 RepID=UPI00135CEE22|nr:choice-of-anchor P family protein [Arthrobacter sp. 18067]